MALFDLPECSAAFAKGDLSYSKARAMTRIATPENEKTLLAYACCHTASQVEGHCLRLRNADRVLSTQDANQAHRRRYLCCNDDGTGSITLSGELPREVGLLVMKALEMAAAGFDDADEGTPDAEGFQARQADALVELANVYLAGGVDRPGAVSDAYQVLIHVDESALEDAGGESDLPIETVRRLTCDGHIVEVKRDADGQPLDLGRRHRVVSPPLRRALLARDRCCRFPGCSHSRYLHAHHVMHWALGGETNLRNTILLCARHHRLLHEGGYSIKCDSDGRYHFRNKCGRVVAAA